MGSAHIRQKSSLIVPLPLLGFLLHPDPRRSVAAHAGLTAPAPAAGSHASSSCAKFPGELDSRDFPPSLTFVHKTTCGVSRKSILPQFFHLRHSTNFPRSGNLGRCRNDVLGRLAARLTDDGKVSCLIEVQTHLEPSSRGASRAEAKRSSVLRERPRGRGSHVVAPGVPRASVSGPRRDLS